MLAVEEIFAASQGYDADQRRRLTFIARTYLEHEWAGPRSDVSLLEYDKSLGFAGHDRVFPEGYSQIIDRLAHFLGRNRVQSGLVSRIPVCGLQPQRNEEKNNGDNPANACNLNHGWHRGLRISGF